MLIHVYFAFPETAGKTLEETEAMFTDPIGPALIGTPAWKTHKKTHDALLLERGDIDPEKIAAFEHAEQADRSGSGSDSKENVPAAMTEVKV